MLWTLKKIWYRIYQNVFKVAMCFMDWSEPELLEGAGSVLRLPEFIKGKGINKVLVVTDKGLMGLHLLDPLFAKLEEVGVDYVVYDGVQPNPTIPNIEAAREMYLKNMGSSRLRLIRPLSVTTSTLLIPLLLMNSGSLKTEPLPSRSCGSDQSMKFMASLNTP